MASVLNEYLQETTALTADSTSKGFLLSGRTTDFIGTVVASSVNAATTIAAKIQHSHDNLNWFDLITFTNIVGVSGAQAVLAPTGGCLPFVRSVVVLTGATKSATVDIKLWYDTKG